MEIKMRIIKDTAVVEEGGNSFLGKLLANHKGKIKINTPQVKGEFEIADEEAKKK